MNRDELIVRTRRGCTLAFDPKTHTYTLQANGEEHTLPSVTRVLSILARPRVNAWAMERMARHVLENYTSGMSLDDVALLVQEARGVHLEVSRKATGTGSEVHDWIEAFLQGEPRELPEDASFRKAVQAFLGWWEEEEREVLLSEEIVAHPGLLYAGKVDLLLADGTLIDFKTSKALYPEYELQLGGYALAHSAHQVKATALHAVYERKGLKPALQLAGSIMDNRNVGYRYGLHAVSGPVGRGKA